MANIPEFISILRRIRDVIYPEVESIYESTATLESQAEQSKITAAASASASASSAAIATTRANEIKNVSAQANTLSSGSLATVSYNSTDGKFTFGLPVGAKGDKGESYTINATGTTAGRAAYDTQSIGFSYLDIILSIVYFKLSATSGDWSTGTSFGRGEDGANGADGTGIASIVFHSTTSDNGLASQPGGIDTYRITLSNSNTYDISLTNGNDLNINGYEDKTIPKDDDEFAIADSNSYFNLKKLSIRNLKSSINSGFKNYIINGKKAVNQRALTSTNNSYNQDRWYKSGVNWFQGIEGNNNLISGKEYTLSWVGEATASYYVGTATSADINTKLFISISNGSSFELNIASGQNLWIKFVSDSIGSTFNFVQLEEGSVATPFENRPYGLELSLCQRYFYNHGAKEGRNPPYNNEATGATGVSTAGTIAYRLSQDHPSPMRATPTVSYSGTIFLWNGPTEINVISISLNNSNATTRSIDYNVASAFSGTFHPVKEFLTQGSFLNVSAEL